MIIYINNIKCYNFEKLPTFSWSQLINNNARTMRHSKLKLDSYKIKNPFPNGHHVNGEILNYSSTSGTDAEFNDKFSIFVDHRSTLRSLTLSSVRFNCLSTAAKLLNQLKQLTFLKIESSRAYKEDAAYTPVILPNLQTLIFVRSSLKFFKLLNETTSVKKLTFFTYMPPIASEENHFSNYLERLADLRELSLIGSAPKYLDTSKTFRFR